MRAIAILTAAVLAVIGIGIGALSGATSRQGNESIAKALAARLLAAAVLPRGAVLAPPADLVPNAFAGGNPGIPGAIHLLRGYLVPGSQDSAFNFLTTHTPRGLINNERGSGVMHEGFVESLTDEPPTPMPPIIAAQLGYTVTMEGTNEALVAVDVVVAWNPDRAATEVVPVGSTALDISLSEVMAPGTGVAAAQQRRVEVNRQLIDRLAAIVNSLPVARPETILGPNCDKFETWRVSFTSAGSAASPFVLTTTSCGLAWNFWTVAIHGRQSAPLSDWRFQLIDAVAPLFGSGFEAGSLEALSGTTTSPVTGVVSFANPDGVRRRARTSVNGDFSTTLPFGVYAVEAIPAGSNRPCRLTNPHLIIDPDPVSIEASSFQCLTSTPPAVSSPTTARQWYRDDGGATLLGDLHANIGSIINTEKTTGPRTARIAVACNQLARDLRDVRTSHAGTAASSLTPALAEHWMAIIGGASALEAACRTALEPALVTRNATELEQQLITFSASFTSPTRARGSI